MVEKAWGIVIKKREPRLDFYWLRALREVRNESLYVEGGKWATKWHASQLTIMEIKSVERKDFCCNVKRGNGREHQFVQLLYIGQLTMRDDEIIRPFYCTAEDSSLERILLLSFRRSLGNSQKSLTGRKRWLNLRIFRHFAWAFSKVHLGV